MDVNLYRMDEHLDRITTELEDEVRAEAELLPAPDRAWVLEIPNPVGQMARLREMQQRQRELWMAPAEDWAAVT